MENDMVMVRSVNSSSLIQSIDMVNIDPGKSRTSSNNSSEEDGITVLYKNGDAPYFCENESELQSLSIVCSQDGSPLEQRDDIVQTKKIPDKLKEVLNFNDEVKLREVEDQMKARENIDQDMENEIQNIQNMASNDMLEDGMLLEAARIAREKSTEVRHVAKGKTTLKRAMEVIEVALPPFLSACEKSYEKNDLSDEVEKESQLYEMCLLEKRKAALDFDLGQQKTVEAYQHLDNCIEKAKDDEIKISEKYGMEIEYGRLKTFADAKNEMDDIIKSELDEVKKSLKHSQSDLKNIDIIAEEQEKRFHSAARNYEMSAKTLDTKINVNRKNQEDLRAQLENLEKQERRLAERRTFEKQVQERANEWNEKVAEQLAELRNSIQNIQSCATTSLKVMELMKDGGSNLLTAAIKAEQQYLNHLRDLDTEAKYKWRTALATSAVEKRLAVDFATSNMEDYQEKYKCMKVDLNKAVQHQKRLEADRLKKEMKEYRDEVKQEDKKKKIAEEELNILMEKINQCDEQLLGLGRHVDSVDTLYEWKRREIEVNNTTDDYASLGYSEDEVSDNDD